MKTISELARELDISPQAIYKKINNQLKTELATHIHKGPRGEKLIDEEGQLLIKNSLNLVNNLGSQPVDNQFKGVVNENNTLIELLKAQLEAKDEQIRELLKQNDSLIKKIENMQILLKSEQEKNILLLEDDQQQKEKKSMLKRIFARNK